MLAAAQGWLAVASIPFSDPQTNSHPVSYVCSAGLTMTRLLRHGLGITAVYTQSGVCIAASLEPCDAFFLLSQSASLACAPKPLNVDRVNYLPCDVQFSPSFSPNSSAAAIRSGRVVRDAILPSCPANTLRWRARRHSLPSN